LLTTPRTRIRRVTIDDAPFIVELLNDPDFIRFIADRGVRDLKGATEYIRMRIHLSYDLNGYGLFLVEDAESHEPMGLCGLVRREELDGPDLGYAFLPRHRGRGVASEAAAAVVAWAAEAVGVTRLYAVVDPENTKSVRVLEGVGFRFERPIALGGDTKEISLFVRGGQEELGR